MYLHYAVGRTPTDAVKHSFWQEEYLMPAETLLNYLLNKNVIYFDDDLKKSLQKKKVLDLKSILRSHELKLSGNKDDLIERIAENKDTVKIEELNLEPILRISDEYFDFYSSTEFINYGHHSNYISIFDIYNYYQSSPDKNKNEIILGTMIEKYKIKLDDVTKHDAKMLSGRISDYYLTELNDIHKGYYYLNCNVMIQVMQNVESYRGMLAFYGRKNIEIDHVDYLFRIYDKNIQTYKKLFYTNQLQSVNVGADMYSHTNHLPYSDTDRKLVSNFVFHYFKDQEEAEKTLMYEIEKRYFNSDVENKPHQEDKSKIDSVESGFKRFMKNIFK